MIANVFLPSRSCVEFAGYLREYVRSEDHRYPARLASQPSVAHPPPPPRLSPSSEARLQLLYKRSVRSSTDPYKRAVHCLVGRCEVADCHASVCSKTEDYMWLKVRW